MPAAWLLVAAFGATVLGFGWLALALDDHWQQALQRPGPAPAARRALRVLGTLALAASLALCLAADRPSIAALVWLMLLAAAAVCIALTLAWRATWLRCCWPEISRTR